MSHNTGTLRPGKQDEYFFINCHIICISLSHCLLVTRFYNTGFYPFVVADIDSEMAGSTRQRKSELAKE